MHEGIHTTTAMDSGDQEHLSHNSRQRQAKIDAQAAEIANMKSELNKTLQENKKLKSLFSPEKMVEAMTKAVSAELPNISIIKGHSILRGLEFHRQA